MADDAITPDDGQAPDVPDTPEPVVESGTQPEGGTPAEQQAVDWEKRYKDLQSEYTRTSQEAAELRRASEEQQAEAGYLKALSDPETQDTAVQSLVEQLGEDGARQWLQDHGFELEDPQQGEQEFRDPRVDQLLSEREQEKLNATVQQVEQGMETTLDGLAKEKGIELSGELRELILDAAVVRPNGDGHPDVKGVFEQWAQANEQLIAAYRQKKRAQPTPPVTGSSGTPNPSLNSSAERLKLANSIADEAYAGG